MSTFKFAHVTDSHLFGRPNPKEAAQIEAKRIGYRKLLDEAASHDVELLIHTGDFCTFGADEQRYTWFREIMENFTADTGIPHLLVRGNHDSCLPDDVYDRVIGPSTFIHHHRDWSFIGMDRYHCGYEHAPKYWDMDPAKIDWLIETLKDVPKDRPLVLLLHENPIGITRFHRGDQVMHAFEKHNLRAILFGHVQTNTVSRIHGIPTYTVAGEARGFTSAPLSYGIATCQVDGTLDYSIHPYVTNTPQRVAATSLQNAAVQLGDNWPDMRGPTGKRTIDQPLPDSPPAQAWRSKLAGPHCIGAPAVVDGKVFIGTMSAGGFEECRVQCFDARSGNLDWETKVDAGIEGGVLVEEGKVFAGTTCGSVYALDQETGDVLWRWNSRENLPITAPPVLHEGVIHIGANWECYAIHADTGKLAWRRLCTETAAISYFSGGHAAALISGDRVVHQRPWNPPPHPQLQSMRAKDGGDLKHGGEAAKLFPGCRHGSALLMEDGRIVANSYGLAVYESAEEPEKVKVEDGGASAATPAIHGNRVYLSHYKSIDAYDIDKVERLWSVPHEPSQFHFGDYPCAWWNEQAQCNGNFSAPLAFADGALVADAAGNLRALNTTDGSERWRINVGSPVLAALSWSGKTLFIATYEGDLLALVFA